MTLLPIPSKEILSEGWYLARGTGQGQNKKMRPLIMQVKGEEKLHLCWENSLGSVSFNFLLDTEHAESQALLMFPWSRDNM